MLHYKETQSRVCDLHMTGLHADVSRDGAYTVHLLLVLLLQGYSTLGSQWLMKGFDHNPVLTHPAIVKAAADAQRSPAQVVLRWALQHGQVSALPCHAVQSVPCLVLPYAMVILAALLHFM